MRKPSRLITVGMASALAAAVLAAPSLAAVPTDTSALRDAVAAKNIQDHLKAFQAIADANDDTRASGTPGYDASADYVAELLKNAGYTVTRQEFQYELFRELSPSVLDPVSPDLPAYTDHEDFIVMEYSGAGDVTAPLIGVDLVLPPGSSANTSTSGCETSDFVGFPAGAIALMQRGTCSFRLKVENAAAAGAVGAVIFNEGQEGRTGLLNGTLSPPQVSIPAVGTTFAVGEELASIAGPSSSVRLATDVVATTETTENVIADSAGGRSDRTVVVGAHLDSVLEGPGINDNGSGSAAILETALQMAELEISPRNAVRFAFWGAEESGLIGSNHYVASLTKSELKDIALYLNFDMIGSTNYVRFVYDGDGSAFGLKGPNGSGHIEETFTDYFSSEGLASDPTEFSGRSDYQAFINAGIPAGGLFTGAEGVKTAEQAAVYGGEAGVAYDPCYHQACDDISNISMDALEEMSDAAAHATLTYAMTSSDVNGTGKASPTAAAAITDNLGHQALR